MPPCVIVTRAPHQSEELIAQLRRVGLDVIHFPVLRIRYQSLSVPLDHFDWIAFTSANAVESLLHAVGTLTGDIRIAAIGKATARALTNRDLTVDLMPSTSTGSALIEAFCSLEIRGKRILVPTSDKADTSKWNRLREKGATVQVVVAYTNECETNHTPEQIETLTRAQIVLFTSPSAFTCFLRAVSGDILSGLSIAVIGPTTRAAVEAERFQVDIVPEQPTMQALVDAVVQHFKKGIDDDLLQSATR